MGSVFGSLQGLFQCFAVQGIRGQRFRSQGSGA